MFSATDIRMLHDDSGQSTVEAAFALPILMILILLLLQPGIVLYDRVVMGNAAAEGCRMLATSTGASDAHGEDYIRRRLAAIPQIDQFHVHSDSCSWDIRFEGDESSPSTKVTIFNQVKPLPLLDCAMALAGLTNGSGNLVIEVSHEQSMQPSWVESSSEGRSPSGWVQR